MVQGIKEAAALPIWPMHQVLWWLDEQLMGYGHFSAKEEHILVICVTPYE